MLTILKRSSIFILPYWVIMSLFFIMLWFCPKDNALIAIIGLGGYNLLLFASPLWLGCAIWMVGYKGQKELFKPAIFSTILVFLIDLVFVLLIVLFIN
ncbi:MAG: hypothetical protein K2K48_04260 [Anaeroplasmataceae bacterium]|nr:hypothetical protein [Anaeroplasmataceae bacterium]MDE6414605.1 hypothetical protein [Anaeroplasmataceae bacterium]